MTLQQAALEALGHYVRTSEMLTIWQVAEGAYEIRDRADQRADIRDGFAVVDVLPAAVALATKNVATLELSPGRYAVVRRVQNN